MHSCLEASRKRYGKKVGITLAGSSTSSLRQRGQLIKRARWHSHFVCSATKMQAHRPRTQDGTNADVLLSPDNTFKRSTCAHIHSIPRHSRANLFNSRSARHEKNGYAINTFSPDLEPILRSYVNHFFPFPFCEYETNSLESALH